MELLYKYYSNESEYAFQNFEAGNICFSPLESLNDPFEGVGTYLYQVSGEEQRYWDSIGSDLPKLLSKRFSEDLRDMVNFNYRVFCTSKDHDNCLLWSYYANSHKGFCVGYEESNIIQISDELFDVEYSSEMCVFNEFTVDTCKKLLSVKSDDWSNEKERRALYVIKKEDVLFLSPEVYYDVKEQSDKKLYKLHGHVQTNNLKTLCAERYIVKKCKPSVVYLGLRMDMRDKKRLINIARKNNIKVYQMAQEQDSFKFIPMEINVDAYTCGL